MEKTSQRLLSELRQSPVGVLGQFLRTISKSHLLKLIVWSALLSASGMITLGLYAELKNHDRLTPLTKSIAFGIAADPSTIEGQPFFIYAEIENRQYLTVHFRGLKSKPVAILMSNVRRCADGDIDATGAFDGPPRSFQPASQLSGLNISKVLVSATGAESSLTCMIDLPARHVTPTERRIIFRYWRSSAGLKKSPDFLSKTVPVQSMFAINQDLTDFANVELTGHREPFSRVSLETETKAEGFAAQRWVSAKKGSSTIDASWTDIAASGDRDIAIVELGIMGPLTISTFVGFLRELYLLIVASAGSTPTEGLKKKVAPRYGSPRRKLGNSKSLRLRFTSMSTRRAR